MIKLKSGKEIKGNEILIFALNNKDVNTLDNYTPEEKEELQKCINYMLNKLK